MIDKDTQALIVLEAIQLISMMRPVQARELYGRWLADRSAKTFSDIISMAEGFGAKLTADWINAGETHRESWPRQKAAAAAALPAGTPPALANLNPEQLAAVMTAIGGAPKETARPADGEPFVIPVGGEK